MNARLIDHQQATKNMMAERYLLGELNENERDAFEEHLFECSKCFAQVKAGAEFVSSLKEIGAAEAETAGVHSGQQHAPGAWFLPKSSLVFAVMFLCVASLSIYQGLRLRQMSKPEVVSVQTIHPEGRSKANVVRAFRNRSFELRVVFAAQPSNSGRAQILNEAGKEITSIALNDLHTGELQVRLSAGMFRPGKYILRLTAFDQASAREIVLDRYPFELTLQD
jgi:anti-sigma-K factor RskA